MYSGSDSESANYAQWPLNPTFFQNMPNEQVDWAALAQQWIQMKEAGPPIPEPKLVESKTENNGTDEIKINSPSTTNDGITNPSWSSSVPVAGENFDNSWSWKSQQNWDWNNTWNPQLNATQVLTTSPKSTLLPTPKGYMSVETPKETLNTNSGYTTVRNNEFSSGYSGHSTNHSRHYKPHNRRYSKVNVPKPVAAAPPVSIPTTSDIEGSSLDASKRKQLPAWIREGLEKMERDKQKLMEKEKEKEKQTIYTEKFKEQEKETMEILKDTIKERRRSKFDSDDEQSPKKNDTVKEEVNPLSHDELMLLVRRKMTEILLKVTNEAIQSICTEERQRYIKKLQNFGRTSGKGNLSAKLGLGMYGSDSGSETDESENSRKDSDDELKIAIKKRKADFVQTEKGIEDKLLLAEQSKTNSKVNDEEEGYSSDNHLEESTSETKKHEEKELRNKSHTTTKHRDSSSSSEESDKVSSRKKSSSRSRESSISSRKKNRSRSRDRGYTPEKWKRNKSPKRSRSRSYDRRYSSDVKYKKDKSRSDRSRRSRSRTSRRSRSRSSSYRSRRSSETSSRSRRKRSRSPYYSRNSRRSRSRSHNKSSRTR